MSVVIKTSSNEIIWFDAITQYEVVYKSSVTKHPVSTGGYVSDHTTKDNVVINLSGILSDADFNISRESAQNEGLDLNSNFRVVPGITINDSSSPINKILPEVIAQFTKDTIPEVVTTTVGTVKSAETIKNLLISMWKSREEFSVVDINGGTTSFNPCVFTNLSFREDNSTGTAVFPVMTIEQVVYTTLEKVSVKIKTSNKGRQTGDVKAKSKMDTQADIDKNNAITSDGDGALGPLNNEGD